MTFDPVKAKKERIEAAKAAANAANTKPNENKIVETRKVPALRPEDASEKLIIVFDNSGSMGTYTDYKNGKKRIDEAKQGSVEFLRNCTVNKDAVAIFLLNNEGNFSYNPDPSLEAPMLLPSPISDRKLTTDLILLASAIDDPSVEPTGGTPLFETLEEALKSTPTPTRIVAFSDGEASSYSKGTIYALAKNKKIPIDTVYFGPADSSGATMMKEIAEQTGGIFLAFDPAKGVSFATAFKYLAPTRRLALMSEQFKKDLQDGKIKL